MNLTLPAGPQSQAFLTALRTGPAQWCERMEPQPTSKAWLSTPFTLAYVDRDGFAKFVDAPYRPGDVLALCEMALMWAGGAGGEDDERIFSDSPDYPRLLKDRAVISAAKQSSDLVAEVCGNWECIATVRYHVECLTVEAVQREGLWFWKSTWNLAEKPA